MTCVPHLGPGGRSSACAWTGAVAADCGSWTELRAGRRADGAPGGAEGGDRAVLRAAARRRLGWMVLRAARTDGAPSGAEGGSRAALRAASGRRGGSRVGAVARGEGSGRTARRQSRGCRFNLPCVVVTP
jgi:hypothetical protein